jgi:acetyl-CoA acyltransferase
VTRQEVWIVDAVRSPVVRGRRSGDLVGLHPADLLAQVLKGLVSRVGIDPTEVDDVIAGCVTQTGEQSSNIARSAVLAAGFPDHVPGTTVDRQCGSSQQAVAFGSHAIAAGAADLVIACGVESMSRVPMFSNVNGADPYGAQVADRYAGGLVPQGIAAELVAARWSIGRAAMDDFALRSHELAARARRDGAHAERLIPVARPDAPPVSRDDGIREGTSVEALAKLEPAFADPAYAARFPEIDWSVTAGNASQISDGAAAVLLASPDAAERLGLRPRARVVADAVVGADPIEMLTAVVPATERVLQRAGLLLQEIDAFEVNEAFACVPLAWLAATGAPESRLNQCGGAIALGHPLGASGARLLATLLDVLDLSSGRYGLQTMCEAGGLANATVVERLSA